MSLVILDKAGQVGLLTLNRPEALNALNLALLDELDAALTQVQQSQLRCLILTGAGDRAFVAGADIAEMHAFTPDEARDYSRRGNALMSKLAQLGIPVIAAVNGYALGGGLELALACDLRIAADNATFAFPEVGLGILPGFGGIHRALRLLGPAVAGELVYTARRVKAEEALRLGLVGAVVSPGELLPTAMTLAECIAAQAPIGVRNAKAAMHAGAESEPDAFAACFGTGDQQRAMQAFLDKKKPGAFLGR